MHFTHADGGGRDHERGHRPARESERTEGRAAKALRRASRAALMWPEEAGRLRDADRPFTELRAVGDRKSTRLNSSHGYISYAVFCLKKKNNHKIKTRITVLHYR